MNRNSVAPASLEKPWLEPWPADGLETVSRCPVCGHAERDILHADLIDNAFRAAPGKWTLWRCAKCNSAYLDPRPSQATIHLAYANYYTHQETVGRDDYASLSQFRKLRRRLVNGYINWQYSTSVIPASVIGVPTLMFLWPFRKRIDREYRHLPCLPEAGGTLLDVGCGDCLFLNLARTCGWDVVGLDPDPKAVANGIRQKLTVFVGGIEYFDEQTELFDVITLSHVIEHLSDPVKVLEACHGLLKPGGQLWLETPNIESIGHVYFQENWRGLEPPRHLVLFS